MVQNYLVVGDGNEQEAVEVQQVEVHEGTEFAYVEGVNLEGWVKVPDNPLQPVYNLVCTDCGHSKTVDGQERLVDVKHVELGHEDTALVSKQIHEIKHPSHKPRIEVTP